MLLYLAEKQQVQKCTNFIDIGLVQQVLESTIYRILGNYAHIYTTDAVWYN